MILWAGGLHVIEYKDIVDRFPIPAVGAEITLVPGLAAVRTEPFGIPGQGSGDHKHQSRRCGGLDYILNYISTGHSRLQLYWKQEGLRMQIV